MSQIDICLEFVFACVCVCAQWCARCQFRLGLILFLVWILLGSTPRMCFRLVFFTRCLMFIAINLNSSCLFDLFRRSAFLRKELHTTQFVRIACSSNEKHCMMQFCLLV